MERICFTDSNGVEHCIYLPLLVNDWWHWHWPPEESFRLIREIPDVQILATVATLIPTIRDDRLREGLSGVLSEGVKGLGDKLPAGFQIG